MTIPTVWLLVLAMAVATYLLRASFILLLDRLEMPELLNRALRYVPAAVLSALVLPAFLYTQTGADLTWGNERLLSGLVAMIIVYLTRNVLLTIGLGMACLWIMQALG
jgi:branched-subunit amino acid transport protein